MARIRPKGFTQAKLPALKLMVATVGARWNKVMIIGAEHIDMFLHKKCCIIDIDRNKLMPYEKHNHVCLCGDAYDKEFWETVSVVLTNFDLIYLNLHGGDVIAKQLMDLYPNADILMVSTNRSIKKLKAIGITDHINLRSGLKGAVYLSYKLRGCDTAEGVNNGYRG